MIVTLLGNKLTTMTLTELINRATALGRRFNTTDIPLKYEGKDVDIDFEDDFNAEGWIIDVKIK